MQYPNELLKGKIVALRGALAAPDVALAQGVAIRWALGARDLVLREEGLWLLALRLRLRAGTGG